MRKLGTREKSDLREGSSEVQSLTVGRIRKYKKIMFCLFQNKRKEKSIWWTNQPALFRLLYVWTKAACMAHYCFCYCKSCYRTRKLTLARIIIKITAKLTSGHFRVSHWLKKTFLHFKELKCPKTPGALVFEDLPLQFKACNTVMPKKYTSLKFIMWKELDIKLLDNYRKILENAAVRKVLLLLLVFTVTPRKSKIETIE